MAEITMWILAIIVFYSFVGYFIMLYILVSLKKIFTKHTVNTGSHYEPEVTLLVAAYNEKDIIPAKIANTKELEYPAEKLRQIWVTDGSTDGSPEILAQFGGIEIVHSEARRGKTAALNHGMQSVTTPIVVFSDANTMLNPLCIRKLVVHFTDPTTGCVAGEKRISTSKKDSASARGENVYWRYESLLKKLDYELYSTVGAAGEIYALRTELFRDIEEDTVVDDFVLSMRVVKQGYRIGYTPDAYSVEEASLNVKEEMKRKVRIAAGAIQAAGRLMSLLNPFKYGIFSFQYFSHKILRWFVAPWSLIFLYIANIFAFINTPCNIPITALLAAQTVFYFTALIGFILDKSGFKLRILSIPYYFWMMNWCNILGHFKYLFGSQSAAWQKVQRKP